MAYQYTVYFKAHSGEATFMDVQFEHDGEAVSWAREWFGPRLIRMTRTGEVMLWPARGGM